MLRRLGLLAVLLSLCFAAVQAPARAQQDPALQTASKLLVEAYLKAGPSKKELPDGSATANWAIMQKVGLVQFLEQEPLQTGSWSAIWSPLKAELDKLGFPSLEPLEALTWWEETRKDPQRFIRLLVERGLIDSRIPKERNRGSALREALGLTVSKLEEVRANVRFERAGWSFTGTASLVPSQRVVRMVLRGSQPCPVSGRARAANVAVKGRLLADKAVPEGFRVQLLDNEFTSNGCEQTLKTQISSLMSLSSGGEARVSGSLVLQSKDEILTGRLQVDLSYRPAGAALQTGHGTFAMRGNLDPDGGAHATLTPISTSGSRILREALNKAGALEGQIKSGQGSGGISMPAFKQPLTWRATGL
jgi:hypothetical protein